MLNFLIVAGGEIIDEKIARLLLNHQRVENVVRVQSKPEAIRFLRGPDSTAINATVFAAASDQIGDRFFVEILHAFGLSTNSVVAVAERLGSLDPAIASIVEFLSVPIGEEAIEILLDRIPGLPRIYPKWLMQAAKQPNPQSSRHSFESRRLNPWNVTYFERYSQGYLLHLYNGGAPVHFTDDLERLLRDQEWISIARVTDRLMVNVYYIREVQIDPPILPLIIIDDAGRTPVQTEPSHLFNTTTISGSHFISGDPAVESVLLRETRGSTFLCHSSGDKATVRKLRDRLRNDQIQCWLDEDDLLPGQEWALEIEKAIRQCHQVVACLSSASVTKAGFVQRELRRALDVADEQPEGSIFLIPVRLDECQIPYRLRHFHYVDLFRSDGYDRLLAVLRSNPYRKLYGNASEITISRGWK